MEDSLHIIRDIYLDLRDLDIRAMRAQGAGGQNVNKVSSAIHLRLDIPASGLPDFLKERLLRLSDSRISKEGVLIIKAQQHRTQELNRQDGLQRLQELLQQTARTLPPRIATKPTRASRQRRLEAKNVRSQIKANRGKVDY